ncbi:MAG: nitroreductase family protein [Burkholderiaceae bacterium]|nr:nitroreductase family protein [Burkholderiaceae bacterium]
MQADISPADPRAAALNLLCSRHSVGPKHLAAPGPTDEHLRAAFAAALRAPDDGKLIPYRFVVVRDTGLIRLAELFVDYGRRHGKGVAELEQERTRARQAPVVIAVVARIDPMHEVPVHEQWIAIGGALTNLLNALHLQGFGAKMLSGRRAADAQIGKAFCRDGEQLVGWVSVGTATSAPKARGADPADGIASTF